jgi:hypothetical protein
MMLLRPGSVKIVVASRKLQAADHAIFQHPETGAQARRSPKPICAARADQSTFRKTGGLSRDVHFGHWNTQHLVLG